MATQTVDMLIRVRDEASAALRRVQGEMDRFNKTQKQQKTGLQSLRRAAIQLGATYGVVKFFKESIGSGAAFEKQVAKVSTMLSGPGMQHLKGYGQGLRRLSVQFGESTETLSSGLYDILSASIAPAKAMDVLRTASRAAIAGMTDTATATDALTTILNSYQMNTEDANIVSDKLFSTVKRGKLYFSDLAGSIGIAAATAATAGMKLDELLASLATMTRTGLKTEQAITAINATVKSFLIPTDEATEAAARYGITLDSTALSTIGLLGVLKKLKGVRPEEVAQIFPNIRAIRGIAAMRQNLEGMEHDLTLMANSAGETENAFRKMASTASFQFGRIKEAGKNALVAFGNMFSNLIGGTKKWADYTIKVLQTVALAVDNYKLSWQIAVVSVKLALTETYDVTRHILLVAIPRLFGDAKDAWLPALRDLGSTIKEQITGGLTEVVDSIGGMPGQLSKRIKEAISGTAKAASKAIGAAPVAKPILTGDARKAVEDAAVALFRPQEVIADQLEKWPGGGQVREGVVAAGGAAGGIGGATLGWWIARALLGTGKVAATAAGLGTGLGLAWAGATATDAGIDAISDDSRETRGWPKVRAYQYLWRKMRGGPAYDWDQIPESPRIPGGEFPTPTSPYGKTKKGQPIRPSGGIPADRPVARRIKGRQLYETGIASSGDLYGDVVDATAEAALKAMKAGGKAADYMLAGFQESANAKALRQQLAELVAEMKKQAAGPGALALPAVPAMAGAVGGDVLGVGGPAASQLVAYQARYMRGAPGQRLSLGGDRAVESARSLMRHEISRRAAVRIAEEAAVTPEARREAMLNRRASLITAREAQPGEMRTKQSERQKTNEQRVLERMEKLLEKIERKPIPQVQGIGS